MVSLALFLIILGVWDKKFVSSRFTIIDILWFPGIVLILINILLVGLKGYYLDFFAYGVGFAFLVLTKVPIEAYRGTFNLIKGAAVVYASGTLIQYFFTDGFNDFIFNFTTMRSQESITKLVKNNYYPGFGFGRTAISGFFIATGLGLMLTFWNNNKGKVLLVINTFIVIFLLTGLVITGKRSIVLWAIVALLMTFVFIGTRKEILKRLCIVFAIFLFGFLILLSTFQLFDSLPFLSRFDNLLEILMAGEASGSVLERLTIYQDAWSIFINNPIFGVGWRQFEVVTAGRYYSNYDVHNLYLQLLCELGVVGFTAVMVPFVYVYIKTFKIMRSLLSSSSSSTSLWAKSLAFSFYYQSLFFIYSLTDSVFRNVTFFLMYFLVIAITNSYLIFRWNNVATGEAASRRIVT